MKTRISAQSIAWHVIAALCCAAVCAADAREAYVSPIHYRPKRGVFADPIPLFARGEYHIFYLRGSIGKVPWEHIVSKDLIHWKELPAALLPDGDPNGPDGENMFTGSVVEGLGQFHIFYTGDNSRNPKGSEFIMHATSPDLLRWTKHPADMIAPDGVHYRSAPVRDFRDPYVFWNEPEKCYWMVFFANDAKTGAGVQGLATSKDLRHWQFQPPLAGAAGQECPDLFQIGDTWYLIGGDAYSSAKNPRGPYTPPPVCRTIDRPQVYAAKRMFDGKRHVWTGWIWDTVNGRDGGPGIWGGSQCLPRELYAGPGGQLYCRPVEEVPAVFAKTVLTLADKPDIASPGGRWRYEGAVLKSRVPAGSQAVCDLPEVPDNYMLDCRLRLDPQAVLALAFRKQPGRGDAYRFVMRPAAREAELSGPGFRYARPAAIDTAKPIKFQAFVQGTIIECFVNDQFAYTCRAYNFRKGKLGLSVEGGNVEVLELTVRVPAEGTLPTRAAEPLCDKTLVVWASPANLDQRGGSVLTIDDLATHFDGIVFGELARKKWMAGSEGFRRAQRDQGGAPAETAGYTGLVSIAITYQGQEVTIYRQGRKYAQYTMASPPQEFGPESVAVIGIRHLAQGDNAHFAGTIEDARIYDFALSPEQILALQCKKASDPKPWAWWTFDDLHFKDHMGRFGATKLLGGARAEWGHLYLDGETGRMIAARTAAELAAVPQAADPAPISDIHAACQLRAHLLANPHRPEYHFVIPEDLAMPFDPNGAIFWNGRYHLFYIYQERGVHFFGHTSSADLVYWRQHPPALFPTKDSPEVGIFSGGCFVNKQGEATMIYNGCGAGNCIATSSDKNLDHWKKMPGNPIRPNPPALQAHTTLDPCGWLEGDTYYAIWGGSPAALCKAKDLGHWQYVGNMLHHTVDGVKFLEDISCPDFFKLGNKHVLLCISHGLGARYYVGQWKNEQFYPEYHERMSWVDPAYFAPESLVDAKGRRIMWAWLVDSRSGSTRLASGWSGEMSLPRELYLGDDGRLRMRPVEEVARLRYDEQAVENLAVEAGREVLLERISGSAIELCLEMEPQDAKQCGLKVCRSPDGAEQTLVYYDAADRKLKIDVTKASLGEGVKNVEAGPFAPKDGEPVVLRVFVDKSIVEAFANDRQAVMRRLYPTRSDSRGVSLFAQGGTMKVRRLTAWKLFPANPY